MLIVRQLAARLAFSAPLLLLTSQPVSKQGGVASPSVAQAQGEPVPARIELSLPPARITPPAPLPTAAPRPRLTPAVRSGTEWHPLDATIDSPNPPSHPAPRPGLCTVARVGRRLVYRKGYLGDVPVHLVVADLNDPEVKLGVMVARGGIGSTESFAGMIHRAQPAAAITGTFFGVHNGLPTGDLVVNGHALYQGFVGTAVAFTEGNLVSFIPVGYKEKTAWQFFDGVMRAGPMLLQAGTIAVGPRDEGFVSISPAARRPRTAVGITADRKLLLLAVKEPISLWRLAKLMRSLHAYHAVAMDGGSSTGLYFHGQMVVRPARALTNSLIIYADRVRYQQARGTFLGRSVPRTTARPASPVAPAIAVQIQPAIKGQTPDSTAAADRVPVIKPLATGATAPPLQAAAPAGADGAPPAAAPRGTVRPSPQEVTRPLADPTGEAAAKPEKADGEAMQPGAPGPG